MKFYVINLPQSVERRENCKRTLDKFNIEYEFFNAVDGRNLSEEDRALCSKENQHIFTMANGKKVMIEGELSPGEVGCAFSHLKLYKQIVERKEERVVIMEDDVVLLPPCIEALENLDVIREHWDIVNFSHHHGFKYNLFAPKYYFGSDPGQYFTRVGFKSDYLNAVFNARRFLAGTFLYVVNYETCCKLINFASPGSLAADMTTGFIVGNRLSIFRPFPDKDYYVRYDDFGSDIGDRKAQKITRL